MAQDRPIVVDIPTAAVTSFLPQIRFSQVDHVDGGMMRLLAEGLQPVRPPADAFTLLTDFGTFWPCSADATLPTTRWTDAP